MKNAIAIRHVAFEDAGILTGLLQDRGIALSYLEAGVDDLNSAKEADLLLVLGGPIGIYEVDRYPFLKEELSIIEAAVKKDIPTIGICLGCQALAAVFAARVYPGREKELGWDEMTLTKEGKASPLGAIDGVRVLNLHGDTFDLPVGATRLASTTITPNPTPRPKAATSTTGHAGAKAIPTAPATSRAVAALSQVRGASRRSSPHQQMPVIAPAKWALSASADPLPSTP